MAKIGALSTAISSLTLLALAAGCQSTTGEPNGFDEFAKRRAAQWQQLGQLKAQVAWRDPAPVTFHFEDHGDVMVRSWFLEGGPGWEYIRARFTYKNTTDTTMDRVRIVFSVEDDRGAVVSASYVDLIHPWGFVLKPGTTFSDEIRVPTNGAHWSREGWRWVVDCRALPDDAVPY